MGKIRDTHHIDSVSQLDQQFLNLSLVHPLSNPGSSKAWFFGHEESTVCGNNRFLLPFCMIGICTVKYNKNAEDNIWT
jgi:hypothetical protein